MSASKAHNQAGAGRSPLESMRTFAESGQIARDNGMGFANVAAAMEAGIDKIDTSLAGLGVCPYIKGATGNS